MGFDWPAPPEWLGIAGILLLATAIYHFSGLRESAPDPTRRMVIALRSVALALFAFLLLRPYWETTSPDAERYRLIALADLSGSMLTKDLKDGPSRADQIKSALDLTSPESWISQARQRHEKVEAFGFDERSDTLRPSAWKRPEAGNKTALGDALRETLAKSNDNEAPAAVIVFSDGRNNQGSSSLEVAKEFRTRGIPVNVVGVGEARATGDVSVSFADRLPRAIAKEELKLSALVRNDFAKDVTTKVRLLEGEKQLLETTVNLDPGQEKSLDFAPLIPESAGPARYRLTVDPPSGDRDPSNDSDSLLVLVQPPEVVTALYFSNRIHPLYPFLKRTLASDERFDFRALIRMSEKTFHAFGEDLKPELPEDPEFWMVFDTLILDASVFSDLNDTVVEGLKRFVHRRGGGLLLFGPAALAREKLGGVAPVREVEEFFAKEDRSLVALEEPIFAPEDEAGKMKPFLPGRLPGFFVTEKNPAARGVVISRANGKAVLVLQAYGAGRVGYWGSPHDWRRPLRDERDGKEFRKFWTALAEWLGSGGEERLRIEDETRPRDRGKAVDLAVETLGSDFEPSHDALVEAKVEGPDGYERTLHLYPEGAVAGRYASSFLPGSPGEYKVTYSLSFPDGEALERENFLRVAETGEESIDVSYNERDLRMLAKLTGGDYLKIDELDPGWEPKMAEDLPLRVERISLADNWVFFLVLFLAAGLEWVFRRQAGLQ